MPLTLIPHYQSYWRCKKNEPKSDEFKSGAFVSNPKKLQTWLVSVSCLCVMHFFAPVKDFELPCVSVWCYGPKNKPALLCFAVGNSKQNLHWLPLFWSRDRNPRAISKSGQIKAKKKEKCFVCVNWSVMVVLFFFLQELELFLSSLLYSNLSGSLYQCFDICWRVVLIRKVRSNS